MKKIYPFIIFVVLSGAALFLFQNCGVQKSSVVDVNESGGNENVVENYNTDVMNTKIMNLMIKAGVPDDYPGLVGGVHRSVSHMICGNTVTVIPVCDCTFYKRATSWSMQTYKTNDSDAKLVLDYIRYLGAPLATDSSVVGYSGYRIINLSCSMAVVPNAIASCTYSF